MLSTSMFSALIMGLVGSTHCIGMCGGIVSTLSLQHQSKYVRSIWYQQLIQLAYNAGRISSYMFIGLIISLFTSSLLNQLPDPHQISNYISGIFFILLGIYIGKWINSFSWLESAGQLLWSKIEPIGRKYIPATNLKQAYLFGLVWGWLPCGLVYSALALSATQIHLLDAVMVMLWFGLGTLPALLLIGNFAKNFRTWVQHKIIRWVLAVFLIAIGTSQIAGYSIFPHGTNTNDPTHQHTLGHSPK